MPEPTAIELTMLEAIQLFNTRPPAAWTAEELAAFRIRLQQTPNLATMLGGQPQIDRKLSEVVAALDQAKAQAKDQPTAAAESPKRSSDAKKDTMPAAKPRTLRRAIEATAFLALLGVAGWWLYGRAMAFRGETEPTKNVAATKDGKSDDPAKKGAAARSAGMPIKPTIAPAPDRPDSETWQDWTLTADGPPKWTRKMEWDLANPNNPPTAKLVLEGPVKFARKKTLATGERFLELRARPLQGANKAERIVVKVNGRQAAEIKVGIGGAKWPEYVSLEESAGKPVELEVLYEPGGAGQQILWQSLSLVAGRREVAKRINCGGPAIDSADGEWEADDKGNATLVTAGTAIWTNKAAITGASELAAIYQTERWAYRFIEYAVPVEPGTYEVVLHFAETHPGYQAKGKRQFDIKLNGETVAEKFDIFATAGANTAHQFRRRVEAKDKLIQIGLYANPGGPTIKGIEVVRVPNGAAAMKTATNR